MLCPFKKAITREQDKRTGKVEIRERFEPCARDRCMAYRPGIAGRCARMEDANGTRR